MWDTLGSDSETGFCYLPSRPSRPATGLGRRGGWYWWWRAIWRGKKSALFSVPLSSTQPEPSPTDGRDGQTDDVFA